MKDGGAKTMTGEGEGGIILEYQIIISITFESTNFKNTYVIYRIRQLGFPPGTVSGLNSRTTIVKPGTHTAFLNSCTTVVLYN